MLTRCIIMSENLFLKPIDFYERAIDPIQQYIQQTAFYLHKAHQKPIDECIVIAKEAIKQGNNPTVRYFERNDNGDRHPQEIPLSQYIREVVSNKEILVPTFTTYLNTDQERSVLVEFTDGNKARRSAAKKEAFKAKAAGQEEMFIIKNNEQNNMKLYNNSMSGAFATQGSVLYNPTAHNTLTSLTRSETAISNASNEKIIAGNRHYFNPDVTLYNIISIVSDIDHDDINKTLQTYNMHIPSLEETITCIQYSADLYWRDKRAEQRILDFVSTLSSIERAAIVYIGDLHHIRLYNDALIRSFFQQLSLKVIDCTVEEPIKVIESTDEQIINLVHQICSSIMKGKGKDYSLLTEQERQTIACTCLNVESTIRQYKDFINTFFLTKHLPGSVANLPNMMRRTVTVSDTDSTLFSVDMWVKWYFGSIIFSEASDGLAASVMYFATQCMAHGLAIFCSNINVERPKLFDMQMKPEFAFPVLAQTAVAKHYFSAIQVKEGNVFDEIEMEIKGVNLKSSANVLMVRQHGNQLMRSVADTVMNNKPLSIKEIITSLADLERHIKNSLTKGETEFLKHSKIKVAQAYSSEPGRSPYFYHMFWQQVFESKYGAVDEPPYGSIKIPTTIVNVSSMSRWLQSIEDKALAERLASFLAEHKKTKLPTIYLSSLHVQAFGIPVEIQNIMDIKKIVLDLTGIQRMIIDTLGYNLKHKWLASDTGY